MRRNIFFYFFVSFLVFCLFIYSYVNSLRAGEKSFRLSFLDEKGKNIKYNYIYFVKRISEMMGRKTETNTETEAVINYTIDDFDQEGNMFISLSFDSLSKKILSPGGEFVADTEKTIDIPIQYKLNKRGRVLETIGLDALPTIPNFDTKGEYDLKSLFIQLPDKEVRINDTWVGEWEYYYQSSSGFQKSVFNTTYKLADEVEKDGFDCLEIETTTRERMSGEQKNRGRKAILSGEMDLKGKIYFAYKEGIIVEKSYFGYWGKFHMKITSRYPLDITYSNFVRAKFSLIK